ncbi:MAG: WG repeat-containing protein, partial [Muribaculaceae bacterium]|nr:WG repeat-containing protein [Muribaculaceae bacterium]
IYDDAGDFYNGLAWVAKNGKRGYVNKSGDTVIPFIYDLAQDFNQDGHAQVFYNGEWITIDKSGNRIK